MKHKQINYKKKKSDNREEKVLQLGYRMLKDGTLLNLKNKSIGYGKKNDYKNLKLTETLKKILSNPNIYSKQWIWEQYDHTVMGDTIQKPGGDSGVVRVHGTEKAVADNVTIGNAASKTVAATDSEGDSILYSLLSGAFPGGMSLNATTGVISGKISGSSATFTFA